MFLMMLEYCWNAFHGFGIVLGSFWGSFWYSLGIVFGSLWEPFWIIQELFWDTSTNKNKWSEGWEGAGGGACVTVTTLTPLPPSPLKVKG